MAVGLRWMLAALGAEGESAASVRGILTAHGFAPPISVRDLAGALAPIRLRFELTPSTCSGWCELAVTPDGTVDYSGHIHNSGLADIRYCTITSVPIPGGPMLVGHQGFVGGTLGLCDESRHG